MNHLDILKKISYGISLSADEARYALSYIGDIDDVLDSDGSRGFYLLALTFGLMAKGLTHEELYGLTLSLYDKSIQFQEINIDLNRSIDISGTGGDIIKTLNVSTTASIILAACGVTVPKQATRSYTSTCGSADLFLELGIDLFNNYDINNIKYSLEKVGVALFYSPMYSPCHKNRVNFLNFLKKINLSYLTPWHIISWIYSPIKLKYRLYGVFNPSYLEPVSYVFQKFGYERTLVVHGLDGLDEISNIGPTSFYEYKDGIHNKYTLSPEDMGVKSAKATDIIISSKEESITSFIKIIYNTEVGAKRDIVILNVAGALYCLGLVPSINQGVHQAIEAIELGLAAHKLEELIEYNGTMSYLEAWKKRAQVLSK